MDGVMPVSSYSRTLSPPRTGTAQRGPIINHYIGGTGGVPFGPSPIRKLQCRSRTVLDALILNGERHGGYGGDLAPGFHLPPSVRICDVGYSLRNFRGYDVLGSLTFYVSDGKQHHFGPDYAEDLISDELDCTREALEIVAVGGKSGQTLNGLHTLCRISLEPHNAPLPHPIPRSSPDTANETAGHYDIRVPGRIVTQPEPDRPDTRWRHALSITTPKSTPSSVGLANVA